MTNIKLVHCEGKVAFESFKQANDIEKKRSKSKMLKRSVYKCKICGKWHLGSIDAQQKEKRRLYINKRTKY